MKKFIFLADTNFNLHILKMFSLVLTLRCPSTLDWHAKLLFVARNITRQRFDHKTMFNDV